MIDELVRALDRADQDHCIWHEIKGHNLTPLEKAAFARLSSVRGGIDEIRAKLHKARIDRAEAWASTRGLRLRRQ